MPRADEVETGARHSGPCSRGSQTEYIIKMTLIIVTTTTNLNHG